MEMTAPMGVRSSWLTSASSSDLALSAASARLSRLALRLQSVDKALDLRKEIVRPEIFRFA